MTDTPLSSRDLEQQATSEELKRKYEDLMESSTAPWGLLVVPTFAGPIDVIMAMLEDKLNQIFGDDGYAITLYLTNLDRPRSEDDRAE